MNKTLNISLLKIVKGKLSARHKQSHPKYYGYFYVRTSRSPWQTNDPDRYWYVNLHSTTLVKISNDGKPIMENRWQAALCQQLLVGWPNTNIDTPTQITVDILLKSIKAY